LLSKLLSTTSAAPSSSLIVALSSLIKPWTSSPRPPLPSSSSALPSVPLFHRHPAVTSDSTAPQRLLPKPTPRVVAAIRRIDALPRAPPRPWRISTIIASILALGNGQRLIHSVLLLPLTVAL
jgi:hypothetical protein